MTLSQQESKDIIELLAKKKEILKPISASRIINCYALQKK